MTFEEIRKLAAANGPLIAGSLAFRVDILIDEARANADETIYVEKACEPAQWDEVALASLCDLLAYSEDAKVVKWFAARGVSF